MDSINLLGICGSPRKNGNSHFLLEIALEAAEATAPGVVETEIYSISGKTFHPCDACNQCHDKLGYCRHTDDDFGELRDKWHAADAIIYGVIWGLGAGRARKQENTPCAIYTLNKSKMCCLRRTRPES